MPRTTPRLLVSALALAVSIQLAAAPVFDIGDLDKSVSPCTDFNAYANGKWIAANPIPADKTRWGAFDELREKSLAAQHTLVERADKSADTATAGSIEQKIGWLYRSGMDETAIDKAGYAPIKHDLAEIANRCEPRHEQFAGHAMEGRCPVGSQDPEGLSLEQAAQRAAIEDEDRHPAVAGDLTPGGIAVGRHGQGGDEDHAHLADAGAGSHAGHHRVV